MYSRSLTCIFHGPAVFDEGDADRITHLLNPVNLVVAGVMGRTAAAQSGLPVTYANTPPSLVMNRIEGDVALVNRGKTPVSGRRFGDIVASRISGGLVHIECSDGTCYLWNDGDRELADFISDRTGYRIIELQSTQGDGQEIRSICGCLPGEPVMVEGITIGYATAEEAVISVVDGRLVPIRGITLKPHGIEKLQALGCPPLDRAWCKSGMVRSIVPHNLVRLAPRCGRVAVIDHTAIDTYRIITPDICGIITIGDDTTAVCGHIGAVAGVPIFGITDGDADGIIPEAYAPGSVITIVTSGTDDLIGREIAASVPDQDDICWDTFVSSLLHQFSDCIGVVRDNR
ncbi:MAG: DUF2117 domain-containing protein [Methanocalculus sp.]|uniref:DUF2117 domain-containing protein n=1 Tax=Methanocalculus sp. TaxID=2004547 RepID=UPI0027270D81|nr:DUF2117 domain-containing protein [Methanocalculus sp.]MDO9539753.1 DUF2117 domain-containing protein [Methanocalculus sp.]